MSLVIRAKTMKDWMRANFERSELEDLARHGASAGWHGLTYYSDTCKLYERFKDEIWDMVVEHADDYGEENVLAFIGTWNGANAVGSVEQFENLMVWYAAEYYANELTEGKD